MKNIKTSLVAFFLFGYLTLSPSTAQAWLDYWYWAWKDSHHCWYSCDSDQHTFYNDTNATSYSDCEAAAIDQCGDGNFEIDWSEGMPFVGYQLQEIVTPDGDELTGEQAYKYLQNKYSKKGKR